MSDLRELYQDVIFDHGKRPRNFGKPAEFNRSAQGFNPLCGDKVTLYVKFEDNVIKDVKFEGAGCAISTASASLLTEVLKGKTAGEAEKMFAGFHELVTTDGATPEGLGKLEVFGGVREFPARVKCATLAWHTLEAALKNETQPVSTE
jgi:nitrogen fixation protein NifU and related proteins